MSEQDGWVVPSSAEYPDLHEKGRGALMNHKETSNMTVHTDACYEMPDCTACRKSKAPRGRSVPLALYGSYCTSGWPDEADYCAGYNNDPQPGHFWPEERESND